MRDVLGHAVAARVRLVVDEGALHRHQLAELGLADEVPVIGDAVRQVGFDPRGDDAAQGSGSRNFGRGDVDRLRKLLERVVVAGEDPDEPVLLDHVDELAALQKTVQIPAVQEAQRFHGHQGLALHGGVVAALRVHRAFRRLQQSRVQAVEHGG